MTANKIWADDMTAFFVSLAVLLFFTSLEKRKAYLALLSGLSCGIAMLAKMSAVYLVIALYIFALFYNRSLEPKRRPIFQVILDKQVILFLMAFLAVSFWWIYLYFRSFGLYGFTFHISGAANTADTISSDYMRITFQRPWFVYPMLIIYQFPIYISSFVCCAMFLLGKTRELFDWDNFRKGLVLMLLWLLAVLFFLSVKPGKELRYMLIAWPAVAVLSAHFLITVFKLASEIFSGISRRVARLTIIILCLASLSWSSQLAFKRVLLRNNLILLPYEIPLTTQYYLR
jgi:4-amino-4-deoxy-L-arabinose transferase-like glycosyltransferase